MEASTVVIKVRYGDTLRRFIAKIIDEGLNFNMDGLRTQIFFLFNFPADTLLTLTYVDEDGDEVALVDDDDLRDVVRQALNPLRITVKHAHSSGSYSPLSRVQTPLQNSNPISETSKSVPEPLQETVKKLSAELASKVSSSVPGIAELVDHFSEMGLSYLDQVSDSQTGVQSNAQSEFQESITDNTHLNSSKAFPSTSNVPSIRSEEQSLKSHESLSKYITKTTSEKSEVKLGTVKGGSVEASSSEAVNVDVDNPCVDSLLESLGVVPKPGDVPVASFSQEKCFTGISCADSTITHFIPSDSNYSSVAQKVPKSRLDYLPSKNAKMGAPTNYPSQTPWNYPDGSIRYVFNDGVWMYPNPVNEISSSAVPGGNDSAIPPHSDSQRRSISQNDGTGNIFHQGISCDGCGVYPITGPRFKSKVKEDYDLCSICFAEIGNDTDYIRMDRPMAYQHSLHVNRLHGPLQCSRDRAATLPQAISCCKVKPVAPKFDSHFIQDVNIMDETVMAPLTPFTKIWRMRNNGTVVWPQKTQLVWIGGDKLNNELAIEVEVPAAGLPVDQELDVAVDFIAPEIRGRYISYWRMASPTGQRFGQRVWVLIQVDTSVKELPHENIRDLNLNLPPPSNGPEIIHMDLEPMVEDRHPEPVNSNDTMEVGELMVDVQPGNEHEKRFPITDSLLVGSGAASRSVPSAPPSFLPYPIIDLSEVAPPFPSQAPPVPLVLPPLANAPQSISEKNVEEKLLGELEAMGFKQIELNKEILKKNEYNLQETVDDLCGVSEWNPILVELREMGFHDTELNKKLLKKNGGSIMLVVMDLIDGEQP